MRHVGPKNRPKQGIRWIYSNARGHSPCARLRRKHSAIHAPAVISEEDVISEENGKIVKTGSKIVSVNQYTRRESSDEDLKKRLREGYAQFGFDLVDIGCDYDGSEATYNVILEVNNTPEKNRDLYIGFWKAAVAEMQNSIGKDGNYIKEIKAKITQGIERKDDMPPIFLAALKKALVNTRTAYPRPDLG